MAFFASAITGLTTVVTAIGAGVAVWGVVNLLEGDGNDNPGGKAHVRERRKETKKRERPASTD